MEEDTESVVVKSAESVAAAFDLLDAQIQPCGLVPSTATAVSPMAALSADRNTTDHRFQSAYVS